MASRRRLALADELRLIVREEIRAALAPADHSGPRSPAAWDAAALTGAGGGR